jgi:HEAT repeat protein
MLKLLGDEDFGVRMTAADAIGDVGPGATKAIPELIRTLNNDFSGVGQHCRRAIEKIDPEQAKNIMIR